MTGDLPARVDRAAIERIIQRAAELQTGEREIGDSLTPDEVLALGKEVGIPDQYLRQALLEEQGRATPPAPTGLLDHAFGNGVIATQRVVRGTTEEIEQALLLYMEEEELLAVQRRQPGRIAWEPLKGVAAVLRRGSAVFGRQRHFMLERASVVTAAVTPLEPGFCLVALGADLRQARGAVVGGAAALVGIGIAGTAMLSVMTPFFIIAAAPLPMFLGIAWAVGKRFRPAMERCLLGLERVLDHLERGEAKPAHALNSGSGRVIGSIIDEVRKAIEGPR